MGRRHGVGTRGLSRGLAAVPQSPVFEGRFGRMFPNLPVFPHDDKVLMALADSMSASGAPSNNTHIPAGFTYLGQFVDHDITFDPTPIEDRLNDPEALVNFRNPRFDLDSLYGRGRDDSPYLYDQTSPDDVKLLVGRVIDDDGERLEGQHDLPRNEQERALIGDPRNDENTFVSQLHLLFIKFHNKVVDKVMAEQPHLKDDDLFKEAHRIVRWHYQWVVVFDFLRLTIPDRILDRLLLTDEDGLRQVNLKFYRPPRRPFIPVEFSAAAYRFGHTQVRGGYTLNRLVGKPTFVPNPQQEPDPRRVDFRGFRGLPPCWTISWPMFFKLGDEAPQASLKIDTNIAGALATALPDTDHQDRIERSLPRRNLLRGNAFRLPSGQWVARAMGVPEDRILTVHDLFPEGSEVRNFLVSDSGRLPEDERLSAEQVDALGVNTPLWYYVLKEAELHGQDEDPPKGGERLGEVGGRIVAEVLLGLLDRDPLSFLSVQPNWTPELAGDDGQFTMADLIRFADPAAAEAHSGAPHDPQGESDCQRRADELARREQAAQARV